MTYRHSKNINHRLSVVKYFNLHTTKNTKKSNVKNGCFRLDINNKCQNKTHKYFIK